VLQVVANPREDGYILITEYIDLKGLSKYQAELGRQLARYLSMSVLNMFYLAG